MLISFVYTKSIRNRSIIFIIFGFDNLVSNFKVTLLYGPYFKEINGLHMNNNNHTKTGSNFSLNAFTMFELKNTVPFRCFPSSELDEISLFILEHFFKDSLKILIIFEILEWF